MEIIKSNKGGKKLCYEGYMYTKQKSSRSTIKWICSKRRSRSCKGCAITDAQVKRFEARIEHSHKPDFEAVEAAKLYCKIKEDIVTGVKPQQILDKNFCGVDEAIRERFGKREHVKRRMRYHKKKHELLNQSGDTSHNEENGTVSQITQNDLATWAARMMAKRMKLDPTLIKPVQEAEPVEHDSCSVSSNNENAITPSKDLRDLCEQDATIIDQILRSATPEDFDEDLSTLDKKSKRCLGQMQSLYAMQKRGELCDFVLCISSTKGEGSVTVVTRTVIEVHKCVLATVSEKIRKCQENMLQVSETVSAEHIQRVLEFAYSGTMAGVLRFQPSELLLISKAAIEIGVKQCISHIITERPDFLQELIAVGPTSDLSLDSSKNSGNLGEDTGDLSPLHNLNINSMNAWVERASSNFDLEDYNSKSDGSDENSATQSEEGDIACAQDEVPSQDEPVKQEKDNGVGGDET